MTADERAAWRWTAREGSGPLVCVLRRGPPPLDAPRAAADDEEDAPLDNGAADEAPSDDEDVVDEEAPPSDEEDADDDGAADEAPSDDEDVVDEEAPPSDEEDADDDAAEEDDDAAEEEAPRDAEWRAAPFRRRRGPPPPPPAEPSGPTALAVSQGGGESPAAAFALFFTRAMEEAVAAATNADAERRGRLRWRRMGRAELRAYVGLLVLAAVFRSRGEACESLWRADTGRRVFCETMPLGQFRAYSAALRFDDRETREARVAAGDRLAPIGELWHAWTARLPLAYRPGDSVTVDERLVPFRGCCGFRQYMPCKPTRYGLKLWVACDSRSSYTWRVQAYAGKRSKTAPPERDLALRVVLDLTEGLPAGTLVTTDNFFTSPSLATRLADERGLHLLGTLRANRARGLPRALLESTTREPRSCRFAFSRDSCVVSYAPPGRGGKKKNVLLLTSAPSLARLPPDDKAARPDGKPPALLRYNATKGGVDNLDKVTAAYSVRRKTARWPVALFHNVIDVSAYNAFVVWRELHPDWLRGKRDRRRRFLEQLGLELTRDLVQASAAIGRDDEPNNRPPPRRRPAAAAAARKRCSVCPRAKDVKTRAGCSRCCAPLCLGCAALLCPPCLDRRR